MSRLLLHAVEFPVPIDFSSLYITPSEYHAIVFEEVVNLVDAEGEILDEVTIAVEEAEPRGEAGPCQGEFAVYQYSRAEGRRLRVRSRVSRALETRSELRVIRRPNSYRLLRLTGTGEDLDVFAVTVEGREGARRRAVVAAGEGERRGRLLLEGANAMLLRRLAAGGFAGRFAGRTVDHGGDLCEVLYAVDHRDGLVRVVRTVTGLDGAEETMTTLLTAEGRIVSHQWSNSPWRLEGVRPERPKAEAADDQSDADEEVPADLDAYFEKKEDLLEEITEYLKQQPDVQDMIADFMKNLLFDKPEDVIGYADNFFSTSLDISRK